MEPVMKHWKNISGHAKLFIGVGMVESDEIIYTDVPNIDPAFQEQEEE